MPPARIGRRVDLPRQLSDYINANLPSGHLILQTRPSSSHSASVRYFLALSTKFFPTRGLNGMTFLRRVCHRFPVFTVGKLLISLYIGSTAIACSYGAVGSLIVVLLWICSAQIFLFGAEFTKVYASHHRSGGRRRLLKQGP
jgi:membrane protein